MHIGPPIRLRSAFPDRLNRRCEVGPPPAVPARPLIAASPAGSHGPRSASTEYHSPRATPSNSLSCEALSENRRGNQAAADCGPRVAQVARQRVLGYRSRFAAWRLRTESSSKADDLRSRRPDAPQLLAHVMLVELLDRVPLKPQLLGHILDRAGAPAPRQADRGPDTPGGRTSRSEPCRTLRRAFFPPPDEANEARVRVTQHSRTLCSGRKPGKVYVSASRRRGGVLRIGESCQIFRPSHVHETRKYRLRSDIRCPISPTLFPENPFHDRVPPLGMET